MWPSYQHTGVLDCILYEPFLKDPTQALQFARGKKAQLKLNHPASNVRDMENCKGKLQASITTVVIVLENVETKVLKIHDVTRICSMFTKMHFMALVSGLGLCFIRLSDHITDVYLTLVQTFDKLVSNFSHYFS